MIVPLNEYSFLKRAVTVYPDCEAVVCGSLRYTYRQFNERVNRWANVMLDCGVKRGDRVAILSPNCHRMLEAFFGAPLIGAILMPLNFRLIPDDFNYILNHGQAKVIIVQQEYAHLIEEIRGSLPSIEHFLIAGDEIQAVPKGFEDFERLMSKAEPGG